MQTKQAQDWTAAARLVRRAGFGATGAEVDAAVAQGRSAWLTAALTGDPATDQGVRATPAPELTARVVKRSKSQAQDLATEDAVGTSKKALRAERAELVAWWLRRMAAAQNPLPEKLTLVWHNHFATSLAKVRVPSFMLAQNQRLRELGRGDFRTLAQTLLTDAAMLRWLDGQRNTKRSPNENLAREFLELFALGHDGGYTEDDVREGARALTGWTITADGGTQVVARRHDTGRIRFLGTTAPLDAAGYCDAVLAQPGSAPFVARRLWSQLVSGSPPDDATLADLTAAYGPDRDLGRLLTRMLGGPELAAAHGSVVVAPTEWAVGAVRALRVPLDQPAVVRRISADLRALGQLPFYPPSVGGWPAGQAWLSTASVGRRMTLAGYLAKRGDLSAVEEAGRGDRLDAVAHLLGIGGWTDRSAAVLVPLAVDPVSLTTVALNTAEYLVH